METKRIFTESPEDEQWRLLMHYTYPINIKSFLKKNGNSNPSEKLVESISGSLLQAKEYFQACKLSTLQISPLLMYYGTTNLLYGISNLITGRKNKIENHGMSIQIDDLDIKIADINIYPNSSKTGALSVFCNIFCSTCKITNSGKWKIEELFAPIPDLLNDFLDYYKEGRPYVIPVQILKQRNSNIERIKPLYLERFEDFNDVFGRIKEFENNYLPPQYTSQMKYIILHPKMGSENIGIYSISGQKYLKLSYLKNGNLYDPSLEIIMFMALYALGFISRYHPEIWSPFIRNDISGEKLLIEKFLYYSRRLLPNLALNYIIKYLNEKLTHSIVERVPNLKSTLNPYSQFSYQEYSLDIAQIIDISTFDSLIEVVGNCNVIKNIDNTPNKLIQNIPSEEYLGPVLAFIKKIERYGVHNTPEDFKDLNFKEDSPEYILNKLLFSLMSFRKILENINQLIYQIFFMDKLVVLNDNNIINILENNTHMIGQGLTILIQPTAREIFTILGDLILIRHNFSNINELCILEEENISFNMELGNQIEFKLRTVDDNLNPCFGLINNI